MLSTLILSAKLPTQVKLQEIGIDSTDDVLIELANVDGSNEQDFKVTQDDVDLMNNYIVGNIPEAEKENIGKPYAAP